MPLESLYAYTTHRDPVLRIGGEFGIPNQPKDPADDHLHVHGWATIDPRTGATLPEDRLKIGIEPLSGYYHHPRHMVAEGDLVILEHVEEWRFHTGERILHPFVTVMEVRDGRIVRWHDYSNIGNVIDHAPQWWIERIAQGYAAVGRETN